MYWSRDTESMVLVLIRLMSLFFLFVFLFFFKISAKKLSRKYAERERSDYSKDCGPCSNFIGSHSNPRID